MIQLPASLSVDANPTKLAKSLKDEEGDLVTPVQLLKRILSEVTRHTQENTQKRTDDGTTTSKTVNNSPQDTQETPSKSVSWDVLPFAQGEPELDVDGTLSKTLRKMRKIAAKYSKTPQAVKILKPAKGWTSWDPSGKKKKKRKSLLQVPLPKNWRLMIAKVMMVLKNFICNSRCFLQRTRFSCCKYNFAVFIKI